MRSFCGFRFSNPAARRQENTTETEMNVLPDEVGPVHTNGQQILDPDSDRGRCFPDRYRICIMRSLIVILFLSILVLLILNHVSKDHQKPVIIMESITFNHFTVSVAHDLAGRETYLASVNSTVKFTYRNTAKFLRAKVTMSKPLNLNYLELTLATGKMKDFYQSEESQRTVEVEVSGNQNISMYDRAVSIITYGGMRVPLYLDFAVHSRGDLLVKHEFDVNIYCPVIVEPKKLEVPLSLDDCAFE